MAKRDAVDSKRPRTSFRNERCGRQWGKSAFRKQSRRHRAEMSLTRTHRPSRPRSSENELSKASMSRRVQERSRAQV